MSPDWGRKAWMRGPLEPGLIPQPTGATCADFVRRYFGGEAAVQPILVTVTTSITSLLKNDPTRVGFIMFNVGANPLYYMLTEYGPVSSTNGLFLASNGGWVNIRVDQDATLPAYPWSAIASGGNTSVVILPINITRP